MGVPTCSGLDLIAAPRIARFFALAQIGGG